MANKPKPEHRLSGAYRQTFSTDASATVLTDLAEFADSCKDPAVRAGRMDIIARILLQRGKGIPTTAPSVYEGEIE